MPVAAHWPRAPEILQYYRRSLDALDALKRASLDNLEPLIAGGAPSSVGDLLFKTEKEVNAALDQMRAELHHEVVLMLAAAFEAELQVDYRLRVSRKLKDRVSRRFRRLSYARSRRRADEWIRIEDILDVWKEVVGKTEVVGAFRQLVMFRHWLAHGRYWVQKSGLDDIDPYEAWERGRALFALLPGFNPVN